MTTKASVKILILSFFLASCVTVGHSREIAIEGYSPRFSGMTDDQIDLLKGTIQQLGALNPGEITMNKRVYQRLSRFEALFGFSLDGAKLVAWLLSRVKVFSYHNTWTVAVNQNRGTFIIGDAFFTELSELERLYLLIHEARHSDGDGHKHRKCPEAFVFISAGQPEKDLERVFACDDGDQGAYAFQSAFLFELYAYGLFDQTTIGLLYNSSAARMIPSSPSKYRS
ncbi:MAG: hypothetical protein ACE5FY_00755 [Nitrospiria bacterium]